jgi:hypothetical protein
MVHLRVTLILVALCSGGPLLAQTALKYKFKPGDTLRYDLTIAHKIAGKSGDMEFGGLNKQVISTTWTVESVDDKGTAKIRLKVERAKLIVEQGKDTVEVSSDAKTEPDKEPGKSMLPGAKALAKFDGYFTMTAQGEVEKVTIPPETVKAMQSVPGAEKAEPLTEQGLLQTLRANTFVLPREAVVKGKSWTEKMEGTTPYGKFAGELVFTYEGPAERGGVTVDKFVVKPKLKIEPDPKSKVALKALDSAATIYFDPAAGQLVEVSSTQVMEMAGEQDGKKGSQRNESINTLIRAK